LRKISKTSTRALEQSLHSTTSSSTPPARPHQDLQTCQALKHGSPRTPNLPHTLTPSQAPSASIRIVLRQSHYYPSEAPLLSSGLRRIPPVSHDCIPTLLQLRPAMAFGFTDVRQNGFQINSCHDSMTIREGSSSGREPQQLPMSCRPSAMLKMHQSSNEHSR
jgi:hypothetical protein